MAKILLIMFQVVAADCDPPESSCCSSLDARAPRHSHTISQRSKHFSCFIGSPGSSVASEVGSMRNLELEEAACRKSSWKVKEYGQLLSLVSSLVKPFHRLYCQHLPEDLQ
jgi:hypothetical protein